MPYRKPPLQTTHGRSKTQEYRSWSGAKCRCTRPTSKDFHRYGGRGITFDSRWNSFEQFFADMGLRPSPKHSLERIRNHEGYGPDNCCWALPKQQAHNRRDNKLNADLVKIIRGSVGVYQKDLADLVGVSQSQISRILAGLRWAE